MTLKIEWITVIQCRGSDQRYSHAEIEPRLRDIQPGTLLPHPLRPHPRPRGAAAAATAGAGAAAETESTKSTTHLYDLPAVDHAEWWAPPLSPGVGRRCRGFATNVLPLLEIPVLSPIFRRRMAVEKPRLRHPHRWYMCNGARNDVRSSFQARDALQYTSPPLPTQSLCCKDRVF